MLKTIKYTKADREMHKILSRTDLLTRNYFNASYIMTRADAIQRAIDIIRADKKRKTDKVVAGTDRIILKQLKSGSSVYVISEEDFRPLEMVDVRRFQKGLAKARAEKTAELQKLFKLLVPDDERGNLFYALENNSSIKLSQFKHIEKTLGCH